jgi:hypothetical protein
MEEPFFSEEPVKHMGMMAMLLQVARAMIPECQQKARRDIPAGLEIS